MDPEHTSQTMPRAGQAPAAAAGSAAAIDPALLSALEWRLIGPHRGGRVVAVAGDVSAPLVFYFGSTGGGVWKTSDGGITWANISDGFFQRASVGAIAVSESDPNVLYVGMGESTIRGNVAQGDGVYKSTDGGKSWRHLGLADTQHIAKIRIHPTNPDLVYVAALGHAYAPNRERGLYRSQDGGMTWDQILFRSDRAGAIDLSMDRRNPRVLYAAFWEARRTPSSLTSGGPGSSLYKSTDGGDTWTELTHNPGLPQGVLGKVGIAASPAQADRVWALVEAVDGALFRSDDGGATWQRLSEEHELRQRPWYYMHIYADPQQAETVWILNLECWKSTDGGRTFTAVPTPHGDNHDLWIDPHDSRRMVESSDGGACVTFDGGASWSPLENQPTAELYHVTADSQIPYRVYGSQQDNTAISLPSLSMHGAITQLDWEEPGGGECGYIAVRPDDPDIVYAGSHSGVMTRYDRRTGQTRDITVWPDNPTGWAAKDIKYRFQWTFPIVVSSHPPYALYATGNLVFRSTDEGTRWEAISPDLTRNDETKLGASGGPITQDNVSTEYYGTIFAFAESPCERGLLWAGSDDGLVHVSRDDGATWQEVTPPELPPWALISVIEPSPHDPASAYVAATRYKLDDCRPYLFATRDYGRTWRQITAGIPASAFARVVREDPNRRGLLYGGTETGLYLSFDDGEHWHPFQGNLPLTSIHDLAVKGSDLVVATHGRSFWILDDLTPLYQASPDLAQAPAHLFKPRPTTRFKIYRGYGNRFPGRGKHYRKAGPVVLTYYQQVSSNGDRREVYPDAGANPPQGVIVSYYLKDEPTDEVRLSFLDAAGQEIRTFSSRAAAEPMPETLEVAGEAEAQTTPPSDGDNEPRPPHQAGLNRFVWNMRYPDATTVPGIAFWEGGPEGPVVAPGTYQVRLQVGDRILTETCEIRKDPRVPASQEDLDAQFALLLGIHDKMSLAHDAVNKIRELRRQVEGWQHRAAGREHAQRVFAAAEALNDRLAAIEGELIQVRAVAYEDTLSHPIKPNNKLAALARMVEQADAAPTQSERVVFEALAAQVDEQLGLLAALQAQDIPRFDALIRELGIPAVGLPA